MLLDLSAAGIRRSFGALLVVVLMLGAESGIVGAPIGRRCVIERPEMVVSTLRLADVQRFR